jgi:hypothetical protein
MPLGARPAQVGWDSLSPDAPSRMPPVVLNPLRSEQEAFSLLLRVIAIFVVIIALVVIVRAVA